MQHPTLFHKGKNGELRQWRVWTEGADIVSEHGQVNGQLQIARKAAESKNVGRSNETSPEEQAKLEAQSMWTYKVERKYSLTPEAAEEQLPLPMLAHGFKGSKRKKFQYPAHVQPKLDGVRCLAQRVDGEISLTSRQGKPWNVPHIKQQLDLWLPEGTILDGEIYVHGASCQKITSWVRSAVPGSKSYKKESLDLVFHVYDMPSIDNDDGLMWEERANHFYDEYVFQESEHVEKVDGIIIDNEEMLWEIHGQHVTDGYEGAILRGFKGRYLWGYRSADLLKVKEFQDAEFEVIDAIEGIGAAKGCILFICRNDLTDGTFKCTMKATVPERRRMYDERDQYIGKMLTVRFFDRTDDQIPRIFVGGIVFRDAADLPT